MLKVCGEVDQRIVEEYDKEGILYYSDKVRTMDGWISTIEADLRVDPIREGSRFKRKTRSEIEFETRGCRIQTDSIQ